MHKIQISIWDVRPQSYHPLFGWFTVSLQWRFRSHTKLALLKAKFKTLKTEKNETKTFKITVTLFNFVFLCYFSDLWFAKTEYFHNNCSTCSNLNVILVLYTDTAIGDAQYTTSTGNGKPVVRPQSIMKALLVHCS